MHGEWLSTASALFQAHAGTGTAVAPLVLPQDEGRHDHPVEWWYFVGHLGSVDAGAPAASAADVRSFAFEMTAVRLGGVPALGLAPFYYAYCAFIDLDEQTYVSADRGSRDAYREHELPHGIDLRFDAPLGQPGIWRLETTGEGTPVHPGYLLEATFDVANEPRSLRLKALSTKEAVLHGNDGVVDFGGLSMGYYSRTRLAIEGGVKIREAHHLVQGLGWMDHQWGSVDFFDRRWKFFGLQATDGRDVLCVDVRSRREGTSLARWVTVVGPGGEVETAKDLSIEELAAPWGPGYPLVHRLTSAAHGLDVQVGPAFEDQRRVPTGEFPLPFLTFWEGACKAAGAAGTQMTGFMELGGYE